MRKMLYEVPEDCNGWTLKKFLRNRSGVSGTVLKRAKAGNDIYINGSPARVDSVLRPGSTIQIDIIDLPRWKPKAEPGHIHIRYMDEDMYILDKPAPLACQATPKQPEGTLENRLCHYYKNEPDFVFRPINRLDKGTSGLMCCARNSYSCHILQRKLHTGEFSREYLAVVEGRMFGEGTISLPISKEKEATVKRVIDSCYGRDAVTHYQVVYTGPNRTLVRLKLETGRTHQIRVHLSSVGFPIVGDFLYGTEEPELPGRFALHSTYLRTLQPVTGVEIAVESPLPGELRALLNV